jgi:hypothetical protein
MGFRGWIGLGQGHYKEPFWSTLQISIKFLDFGHWFLDNFLPKFKHKVEFKFNFTLRV